MMSYKYWYKYFVSLLAHFALFDASKHCYREREYWVLWDSYLNWFVKENKSLIGDITVYAEIDLIGASEASPYLVFNGAILSVYVLYVMDRCHRK